ncbi:MAG: NADH-quinone oxidoreductase subunit NuoK [Deltaproteobacteria bacterium CG11_big_fil_rev_8_21_14_0_20_49_13]|nr:MAG: NADH-quinone oxidoreductase subunit NuoK [Deltaproteobacteria bacterium CG11_big_fil_rev_8_21_14_0_20_49_13]
MNYLILSLIIFCVGLFGVLIRRNLLVLLMSIELMLSAVNIAFVAFSKMSGSLDGEAIVILNFVLAACEAAVGLAIIVSLYRSKGTIDIGKWGELKN